MFFPSEDIVVGSTAITALFAVAYKVFLRLRGDKRQADADARQDFGYSFVLAELRLEVDRLSQRLAVVGRAFEDEIGARRKLQDENAALRSRVSHLEGEVIRMEAEIDRLKDANAES